MIAYPETIGWYRLVDLQDNPKANVTIDLDFYYEWTGRINRIVYVAEVREARTRKFVEEVTSRDWKTVAKVMRKYTEKPSLDWSIWPPDLYYEFA